MSLFNELKRRNVFRVAVAYLISAWVVAQVADLVLSSIQAPSWVMKVLLLVMGLGFIAALIISWAYEITPEGIKKEKDVVRDNSITNITSKKLNYITLFAAIAVLVMFVYQQLNPTVINQTDQPTQAKANSTNKKDLAKQQQNKLLKTVENAISNKSIAVLPFTNFANNPENEPFALGLHDDLLTHLSKISALKVISRTSVMEYKDTTKKINQIAKELGVANILEGGVQRSGNQIRLNVQLIDAKTDEHLWAEIYDRELTTKNIFSIQTEISNKIAAALKAQLTKAESKSISTAPTNNLEAYNAYLAARQLIAKRDGESIKKSVVLFQKASQLDPNYALAYVGQATALRLLNEYSDLPFAEMIKQSEPLIAKAIKLDPMLAAAQTIKAAYLDEQQQYEEAEKTYQYSLKLNPNDAQTYHWYGHMLRNDLGRAKEALIMHRKAAELDPLSNVILANVGWSLIANGKFADARNQFQSIHQLNPKYPGALDGIAWVNVSLGNYAQAVIYQNKSIALDSGYILGRFWLYFDYLNIGDASAARTELEKAQQITPLFSTYRYQESLLDMLAGDYRTAQQRFLDALKKQPDDNSIKDSLALFSVLNGDCDLAVKLWKQTTPELIQPDYNMIENDLNKAIKLFWCLKQTGQKQITIQLLVKIQDYLVNNSIRPADTKETFDQVAVLAIQGKSKSAAEAYADVVESKKTNGWFWVDHWPYFEEMRKQPSFIKAHKQLMLQLEHQRELLAEYRKEEKAQ
jgi:TolB-like protein/Flp pilus assembly protein TadD